MHRPAACKIEHAVGRPLGDNGGQEADRTRSCADDTHENDRGFWNEPG